jgi:hypothetical protein
VTTRILTRNKRQIAKREKQMLIMNNILSEYEHFLQIYKKKEEEEIHLLFRLSNDRQHREIF